MGFENGRVVRVVLSATRDVDEHVNVWHYDLDDEALQENDPQALADLFADDVLPGVVGRFTSDWTVQPVVVTEERDPQNPDAPRGQWIAGTATAGTKSLATDRLPRAATAVATLKTAQIGRRFTGRKFIFGVHSEGDQADGVWTSAKLTDLQAYLDSIPVEPDIAGPGSGSVAQLAVYSRTQRAADQEPYITRVESMVLRNYVRWLRSRQASV